MRIAPELPSVRATGGAAISNVSNVAVAAPTRTRTCAYRACRACRAQYSGRGYGLFCRERCAQRDYEETK